MNLFDVERERYWGIPTTTSKEKREEIINSIVNDDNYICSEKVDGNWGAFIIQDSKIEFQTRGRGVNGEFGDVEFKVPHLVEELREAGFKDDTFLIGEIYLPGGNDKSVGSILRCLTNKALARQEKSGYLRYRVFDCWYLNGESLMDTPLEKRISKLKYFMAGKPSHYVELSEYFPSCEAKSKLATILAQGGEGIVLQKKNGKPEPGKRTARKTLKLKREFDREIDVVCTGIVPSTRSYTGIDLENWSYWENIKTGEKVMGQYYTSFIRGNGFEPITKGYYYGWPGSINCGVFKGQEIVDICNVSGLEDSLRKELAANPDKFVLKPLKIIGMEFTKDFKVRHPRFLGFRNDIDAKDCTWEKIFPEEGYELFKKSQA